MCLKLGDGQGEYKISLKSPRIVSELTRASLMKLAECPVAKCRSGAERSGASPAQPRAAAARYLRAVPVGLQHPRASRRSPAESRGLRAVLGARSPPAQRV